MGPPKKKQPRFLSKLQLFPRVVVKKLTEEEIAQWQKKPPEQPLALPECLPASSIQDESSSGNEERIIRKRRQVAWSDEIESSDSSSSSGSSSDACEYESSARRRRRKRKRFRKLLNARKNKGNARRVLPGRSAKRKTPIIDSEGSEEEEDVSNVVTWSKPRRTTSLKTDNPSSETATTCVPINDSLSAFGSVKEVTVSESTENAEAGSNRCTTVSSNETESDQQSNPVNIILMSGLESPMNVVDNVADESALDASSRSTAPIEQGSIAGLPSIENITPSASPSMSMNISEVPAPEVNSDSRSTVVEESINDFDKLKKVTIVNNDEKNVGKIRLRSLQSLGASDSFIKEANLTPNSRVEIVHDLYADHFSPDISKKLLKEIAVNLSQKLLSTEEFNDILKKLEIQKPSRTEIQNEKLENIVQRRQEYDTKISKLFTKVVELFYAKLDKKNQTGYFHTLLYLGFLYILNHFINVTRDRYKKSSLFKNVVLVFTESLRNGRFKYEQIINFFLTNNFHIQCYKLIGHIGAIQAQYNLCQLTNCNESSLNDVGLMHVPVRKISYKMLNSKMVIEYSKTLEEVETTKNLPNKVGTSLPAVSPQPSQSRPPPAKTKPPPPLSSFHQPPKTVIVSSKSDSTTESGNNASVINFDSYTAPPTSQSVTSVNYSNEPPVAPANIPGFAPNSSESITLHSLLHPSQSVSDVNVQSIASHNQQKSVIHPPQPVRLASVPAPTPLNSATALEQKVNKLSNITVTSKTVPAPVSSITREPGSGPAKTPVQVVRPILHSSQTSVNMNRPSDCGLNKSKNDHVIARSGLPIVRPVPAKKTVQEVMKSVRPVYLPSYSQAAVSRVENSFQTSVPSNSLRQVLLSDLPSTASSVSSNQLMNSLPNSVENIFNISHTIAVSNPSDIVSNCQQNSFYQPALQNPSQFVTQNSTIAESQPSINSSFAFPINTQDMHQYQVQQNQNLNPNFSLNAKDCTSLMGDNQMFYNSNPLNQDSNSLYFTYTSSVSLNQNQTQNQVTGNEVYRKSGQDQISEQLLSQPMSLNPPQVQSGVLPPFAPPALQKSSQYFTPAPNATVHWGAQDSASYSDASMVQPYSNQMQYQNFPQS